MNGLSGCLRCNSLDYHLRLVGKMSRELSLAVSLRIEGELRGKREQKILCLREPKDRQSDRQGKDQEKVKG